MSLDLRRFAGLLRERAEIISERLLAPSPDGPIRKNTSEDTRELWRELILNKTIERIAKYLEDGSLPDEPGVHSYIEVLNRRGISLENALAGKAAVEREVVTALARAGFASAEETCALLGAVQKIMGVGIGAYLRHTEQALQGAKADLLASLDAMGVAVFRADPDSRILSANQAGAGILGAASPAELIGRKFSDCYADPAEQARVRDLLAAGGHVEGFRFQLRRLDGRVLWAETNLRLVLSPEGRPAGIEGFARDITALMQAEDALRHTVEQFRQLVENITDVIYETDAAGVLTYISPVAESLFGYRPDEIVGRRFTDFLHPDDLGFMTEEFAKGLAGDQKPSDFRVITKSGRICWARTSTRPILIGGRPVGLRGVLSDITPLVEAEQARERMAQLMEKLPLAVYEIDKDGVLRAISAGGMRMFGAAQSSDLVGRKVADFYADPSEEPRNRAAAESAGTVTGLRMKARRLDGSTFWIESFIRAVRDESGGFAGREGFFRDITALVEAEQALDTERQHLQHVVRSLGAGLSLLSPDLRIEWYNEQHAAWFGPLEQARGRYCYEVYQKRTEPCPNCPALETVRTGQPCVRDVLTPTQEGEIIFRLTTTPMLDPSGRVAQVLELVQDVTAERAAEAERTRTGELLAGILRSALEYGILGTDGEGRINYFSEGAERLFGLKSAEVVGQLRVADLWLPEARAALAADLAELGRSGRYEQEVELLRAQGVTFVGRVSGSARHDPDGRLAGYTFVIRDVTEDRAAQKLVTLLAHAIESSREGVALTDMSGVVTYVNPAIATMTGREPAELLGKDVSIFYSKDTPGEEIRAIARSTLANGWNGEVTAVRADGSTYPAYMTTSLVRDERGRAVAMVGLWRDISREKSLQRRLFEQEQRHLAELEHQVRERTAELERAYRDLQKLDAMKDRFLTNVSHELRTPLVSGVGYIELILHEGLGPVNDEIRKGLRVAHRNLLRLVNLIDDLLTFTRLGSGKEAMIVSRFDLAQLVNDCLLDLKVRAGKKALHVDMDVERGLPPVEADEENIHRVLTNLLSNAEKFTGEEARIAVSARRVSDSRVEVRVTDDGVGIPADELSQVFDRFYRSRRTTSPRYGGTGIGLSLVKEIIEAHGCAVRAESLGERGTIIVFGLPLAAGPAAAAGRASPARPASSGRRPAAILVVDDDPDVHDLLRTILKDTRDRLVSATDGQAALRAAADEDFDLIFLDLSMEPMDGVEVLRRLRAAARSQDTPVYVLTARADDGSLAESRRAGASGILTKPFTIAEVRQAIEEVLAGGGGSERTSGRLPKITDADL